MSELSRNQANAEPKQVRNRDRSRNLTKVDKRTVFGRRVMELRSVFASTFGPLEMTPLRLMQVREAAELKAIAEQARGDFMRDSLGSLDDIVRIERKAALAVKAIGIKCQHRDATLSLADYLAATSDAKPE